LRARAILGQFCKLIMRRLVQREPRRGGKIVSQPSLRLLAVTGVIDAFTDKTGNAVAWLMVLLVGVATYEVVARYVFHAPTMWAYDSIYMLYGSFFMLGASYALLKGAHIRTDMLWEKYSERKKGIVDAIAYVLFFFPALVLLFFASVDDAYYSWQIGERSEQTAWQPIIYPFKAVIPLTCLLLLIQGVSELLKSLYAARTGRAFEPKQGGEL
jgi:TRAP-type mannitol/chloroaromatic compound transport system permease small subunit